MRTFADTGRTPATESEDLEGALDRLAERCGGRAALLARLSGGDLDEEDEPQTSWSTQKAFIIGLRLTRDELRRLDEESLAMDMPRKRWILALIRRRLDGRPQFSRSDRVNLAGIVRELRKIEGHIAKTARACADRSAPARELLARFDELQAFREQLAKMMTAIDTAFTGNDDYWRVDDGPRAEEGGHSVRAVERRARDLRRPTKQITAGSRS